MYSSFCPMLSTVLLNQMMILVYQKPSKHVDFLFHYATCSSCYKSVFKDTTRAQLVAMRTNLRITV